MTGEDGGGDDLHHRFQIFDLYNGCTVVAVVVVAVVVIEGAMSMAFGVVVVVGCCGMMNLPQLAGRCPRRRLD